MILEVENEKNDNDISTLRYAVANIQKCLNKIDNDKRNLNAIVFGFPETDVGLSKDYGEGDVALSTARLGRG